MDVIACGAIILFMLWYSSDGFWRGHKAERKGVEADLRSGVSARSADGFCQAVLAKFTDSGADGLRKTPIFQAFFESFTAKITKISNCLTEPPGQRVGGGEGEGEAEIGD